MSNLVIFVNYEILPEKREDYLNLMREIKQNIVSSTDVEYSVFESKEKNNYFSEVFKCASRESFAFLNQLTVTQSHLNFLLKEVDKCIKNYTHFAEDRVAVAA